MQRRDVAPDRCFGRVRQLDHLLHRHHRLFLDGGQNDPVALFFVHGSSLPKHQALESAQCQSFPIIYFHCAVQYDRY
jgi:hypothetical protein